MSQPKYAKVTHATSGITNYLKKYKILKKRHPKGVALLGVLFMVSLVTVMLTAFVSTARVDLKATQSYTKTLATDMLTDDAMNSVVADILYEIEQKSEITSGAVGSNREVYAPKNDKDYLPEMDAHATVMSDEGIRNLLKTSLRGVELFEGGSESLASSVSTQSTSLNNRRIHEEMWNSSRLLTEEQNLQTLSDGGAPDWIYVDRNGPVKLTRYAKRLRQTVRNNRINNDYVVGRYAYRVYDTSGLLNINVVGAPGSVSNVAQANAEKKGNLAWLDLHKNKIPGFIGDEANANSIFNWRGPSDANAYEQYVKDFGHPYGFQVTPPSSEGYSVNRFLDRSDLIYYCYSGQARGQFNGENPEEFLTYVNTFSHGQNMPSWAADTTPNASPEELNNPPSGVRVGTPFTRRDGTRAEVGEPLMKTRFPLSRLGLMDPDSEESRNSTNRQEEIEKYFGLTAKGLKWEYIHETRKDSAFKSDGLSSKYGSKERLLTLEEVAAEGREPNFFEILQAGIMADSLGQSAEFLYEPNPTNTSNGTTLINTEYIDRNHARHVLKIGLNIIDQYDTNDDPTVIERIPIEKEPIVGSFAGYENSDSDLAGVENIPMMRGITHTYLIRPEDNEPSQKSKKKWPDPSRMRHYTSFLMWNPHRNAEDFEEGKFRIRAFGDSYYRWKSGTSKVKDGFREASLTYGFNDDQMSFSVPLESGGKCSEVHHLRYNEVSVTDPKDKHAATAKSGYNYEIAGFMGGEMNAKKEKKFGKVFMIPNPSVCWQLEKKVDDGWLPVQTFFQVGKYRMNGAQADINYANNYKTLEMQKIICGGDDGLQKPQHLSIFLDPRVTRFGLLDRANWEANPHSGTTYPAGRAWRPDQYFLGPGTGTKEETFQGIGRYFGILPINKGNEDGGSFDVVPMDFMTNDTTNSRQYADRGGQAYRLADNPGSENNLYLNQEARPVMLNRPFKSVSEIGYACRDLPWKTLNLLQHADNPNSDGASADSALLELFSLTETERRSDLVNLNKVDKSVFKAILADTNVGSVEGDDAKITADEAETIAVEINDYLGPKSNPSNVLIDMVDIAQMVQSLPTTQAKDFKISKDAMLSGLSDVHNARTWHLLIDVIAQTGSFTNSSRKLKDFYVTGQKHIITQVAIDRLTGEIVDQVIEEPVEEEFR